MRVPFCRLRDQHQHLMSSITKRIDDIFQTDRFISGPIVEKFESKFAHLMGIKHAIGVGSGTDALILSLRLLDLQPEDEVIIPVFSFISKPNTVLRVGATPVFVDIDPLSGLIDLVKLEAAITPNTRAIIAVHLYGKAINMTRLMELAKKNNIAVIEDCTHSTGAVFHGRKLGSYGNTGCFSFYPTRNLGGIGDGGMIITDNDEYATRLRKLRHHGKIDNMYFDEIGYNSRLDAIQAAILQIKLEELEDSNAERIENARFYNKFFAGANAVLPDVNDDSSHVFNTYTLQIAQRDALEIYLKEKKIGTAIYYPTPLHLQPSLDFFELKEGDFPQAEQLSKRVISLPVFPGLKRKQIQYVAQTVMDFLTG
jgi:dTDP-4-amino-4,6-dideoxygalactose transaminase